MDCGLVVRNADKCKNKSRKDNSRTPVTISDT